MITTVLPPFLADTLVKIAPVPPRLDGAEAEGVLWQAGKGRFLLEVPAVARYLADGGHSLTIEPDGDGDEEAVFRFLRMTPTAAIVFQRGLLALHAAAVSKGDGAVLIAGDSGAGKSSLAAALALRGWSLLADDLAVVGLDAAGAPVVHPTFPEAALWPDALARLGIDSAPLSPFDGNRFRLPVQRQGSAAPVPLHAVYFLSISGKREVERSEPAGTKRFQALGERLYNTLVADALLDRGAYLQIAAPVAQYVRMIKLQRPRGAWRVGELAELIEQDRP